MTTPEDVAAQAAEEDERLQLSVLDRLRRRVQHGVLRIPFKDDQGTFNVDIRMPTPAQRKRLSQLYVKVVSGKLSEDELRQLDGQVADMIAELCIQPELQDPGVWTRGEDFGVDVPAKLIQVALGIDRAELEDYQFFRENKVRS